MWAGLVCVWADDMSTAMHSDKQSAQKAREYHSKHLNTVIAYI